MTDKELKDLVASVFALSNKVNLQMEETDRRLKAIELLIKENGLQQKETYRQMKENDIYIDDDFFQRVFEKKLKFGKVKYDEMFQNLCRRDKNVKIEFDIALINCDSIALIEVKDKIYPAFVNEFAKTRVKNFRKFFPHYKNYKVYLGIAGFSFCEEVVHRASKYGIGIIGQKGDSVEVKGKLKAF